MTQGVSKLTSLTVFRDLRLHFYRATVAKDYKFKERVEETEEEYLQKQKEMNIEKDKPFETFVFEELESTVEASPDLKLEPTFDDFCKDGSDWIKQDGVTEAKKKQFVGAIEDYLLLRQACRHEGHHLKLNRIGIEKNEKQLNEQAAKYVGLAMPKEFNHQ